MPSKIHVISYNLYTAEHLFFYSVRITVNKSTQTCVYITSALTLTTVVQGPKTCTT